MIPVYGGYSVAGLTRQFVALKIVGSNPTPHPTQEKPDMIASAVIPGFFIVFLGCRNYAKENFFILAILTIFL